MDGKTTIYGLEAGKITFFEECVQAVHSNMFPYFTGFPVSFIFIAAEPGFIISTIQPVTCWCNNLSLAGKRPVWIKLPLTHIEYLR